MLTLQEKKNVNVINVVAWDIVGAQKLVDI